MNACATIGAQEAEAEVDRALQELLSKASDDKLLVAKTQAAQKQWLAYRDAELEARFPHAKDPFPRYGSGFPMLWRLEHARMSRARARELRERLSDEYGADADGGAP
jgi:uncharacterized protein YecT (DUF1311 family)